MTHGQLMGSRAASLHFPAGEVIAGRQLPVDAPVVSRPVPLVELPLGTTEDRLLGALHLERALRGERVFEPGLLAAANRGILYSDEVNLLPDHLVDVLLDTAASGVHRLAARGPDRPRRAAGRPRAGRLRLGDPGREASLQGRHQGTAGN